VGARLQFYSDGLPAAAFGVPKYALVVQGPGMDRPVIRDLAIGKDPQPRRRALNGVFYFAHNVYYGREIAGQEATEEIS